MVLAALSFSLMNVFVRSASETLSAFEIAFFRNVFAVVFMVPWLISADFPGFRTPHWKFHIVRAITGTIAMTLWFSALAFVPLAEAVALNFTFPLFVVAGAALILREQVGPRRWLATAVGFLGVLVILRPGFAEVTTGTLLPVIAAFFMACSMLLLKHVSAFESPGRTVLYMNIFMVPISFVPAFFVWRWPDPFTFMLLALLGLTAMFAHLALARAHARADTSAIVQLDYMRLPFIAALAYFIFGEVSDIWTWVGAAIIVSSAIYISRREAALAKAAKAETNPLPLDSATIR